MNKQVNKTLQGHVLEMLKLIPDESIDCIITSPPYYQLRNYNTPHQIWGGDPECRHEFKEKTKKLHTGTSVSVISNERKGMLTDFSAVSGTCIKCSAWRGELGHEPTIKMFIDHLILVFDACKRVLKPTGTLWVNLGDSYIGGGRNKGNTTDKVYKQTTQSSSWDINIPNNKELPSKCIANVPSRFRIAMTDDANWIQRNNIIWHKPNKMPESVTDRFTVDFEDIMLFTKQGKYFFEQQIEQTQAKVIEPRMIEERYDKYSKKYENGFGARSMTRNMRTVWSIDTQPSPDKHFAMYPEKLLVRMIEAGCPKEVCNKCNTPRKKITEMGDVVDSGGGSKRSGAGLNSKPNIDQKERISKGLTDCGCNAGFHPGVVLDPFSGSGTTGITARKLNRNYINIEIHPDNVELNQDRIERKLGMFA